MATLKNLLGTHMASSNIHKISLLIYIKVLDKERKPKSKGKTLINSQKPFKEHKEDLPIILNKYAQRGN